MKIIYRTNDGFDCDTEEEALAHEAAINEGKETFTAILTFNGFVKIFVDAYSLKDAYDFVNENIDDLDLDIGSANIEEYNVVVFDDKNNSYGEEE